MNEGILNKLGHVLWKKETVGWEGLDPRIWGGGASRDGEVGYKDFAGLKGLYYGTAFTCINYNASNIASIPLKFYVMKQSEGQQLSIKTTEIPRKRKEYLLGRADVQRWMQRKKAVEIEEVPEHPALNLLADVNARATQHNLIEKTGQWLEATGDCFWQLVYGNVGGKKLPTAIWFLNAEKIEPEFNDDGSVKEYKYGKGKDEKIIPAEEVIHFLYPTWLDEFWGCPPIFGASIAARIEKKIQVYTHNTFDNMGVPLAALISEGQLREEDAKKIMDQIANLSKGYRKANKLIALGNLGKGAKIEKLGFNPDEMGFIGGAEKAREWIANVYGWSISMLTDAGSNRATSRTGDTRYWRNTMTPKLKRIDEELTESLASKYDDNGFFAFDDAVPEDTAQKIAERTANLGSGFATINDERTDDKREPVDGGDELLVPSNMIPLAKLLAGDTDIDVEDMALMINAARDRAMELRRAE